LRRGWRWWRCGNRRRTGQFWVRNSFLRKRQLGLNGQGGFPSQTSEEFPNRILADANPPRDLSLSVSFVFELLHQTPPRTGQARAPSGVATVMSQSCQSALLKASLVPSHGAHSAVEGPGYLDLVGPALIHQTHHRMGLGHVIRHRILRQNNPRNQQHAVAILGSQDATIIDNACAFRVPGLRKQVALCNSGHTGRTYPVAKKADSFGCAPRCASGCRKHCEIAENRGGYVRSCGVISRFKLRTRSARKQNLKTRSSFSFRCRPLAAHNTDSPAGERPAMVNDDEPSSYNRRGISG